MVSFAIWAPFSRYSSQISFRNPAEKSRPALLINVWLPRRTDVGAHVSVCRQRGECTSKRKRKRGRELERGDHPQLLPIISPPLLPLFLLFLQAVSVLPQVHQRSSCLLASAQLEVTWRCGVRRKPSAPAAQSSLIASRKPGLLHPSSERYNNHTSPHYMVRRLPSNGKYISLAAALPPAITHTHTNSTPFFSPIFCCSFSVLAELGYFFFFFFFWLMAKAEVRKRNRNFIG